MFRVSAFVAIGSLPRVYSPCMLLHFFYGGFYIFFSRCEEQEEGDDDDEEETGEDPYEFSLSAVIDECARMASHEEHAAGSANEASYAAAKKRKIVQSAYFSDEEDEG